MRRLSSFAWRSLLARPVRTVLTVVGIMLGVAVLFASLAAGTAMDRAVQSAAADELGSAQIRVSAVAERGLSAASVSTIAQTPGVAVSAPAFVRKTYLASNDATPVSAGSLPPPVTILGIRPESELRLHSLPLAEGTQLTTGLERSALITETLARDERIRLGDTITVNGGVAPGPGEFRVVGIIRGDGPLPAADGKVVVLPLEAAQHLFDATGVTRVDVGIRPNTPTDEVMGQLEARLTSEPYMLARSGDLADSLRSSTGDFRGSLLLVAAIVLFAGAFLIFNTLSMTVAERAREVGLLRAAGTTRAQVMDLVLLQAAALGIAGSVAGVAVGLVLVAVAGSWVAGAEGLHVEAAVIDPVSIVAAIAIGVLVTLAAALEPAWRAGRIPPVDAVRRSNERRSQAARLRWLVVVFAALALAALAIWPRDASAAGSVAAGSGGSAGSALDAGASAGPLTVYGLLLLAVLVLPIIQRPLLRIAGIPFRVFRSEERLARSSLARDPSRTALTAGALVIGLAMVVALGTAAQNVRRAGLDWLAQTVPGDELLTSIRPIALDDPASAEIAKLPGVATVSPIALFGAPLDGLRQDAAAVVGADLLADGRLTFVPDGGDRATALRQLDEGGHAILPREMASRLGARVGDRLLFQTGQEQTSLVVAGIAEHTIPGTSGETILMGWKDASGPFGVAGADAFAVRYAAGREASARAAVDSAARSYALEPSTLDRVEGTVGDALERIFALLDALALAAVVVAGLGVVNTLSMNVLERVREIGVLRATGMTSRQVWGMVLLEAAVLGVAGAIVGCVTGLVLGALLVSWSGVGLGVSFELPWASLALAACFGVLVSVVAAIYPARLASRLSIVRALQYE